MSPAEIVGLLTHLGVLGIGLLGLLGVVGLPRGRRSGIGLMSMALAMGVITIGPQYALPIPAIAAYIVLFALGLWLLIGPIRKY
mgnify:CR=1 FL=1